MKEDKNSLKKNTKKQNPRKDALANDAGWMELPLQPANGPGAGGGGVHLSVFHYYRKL